MRVSRLSVVLGLPLLIGACAVPSAYTDPTAGFETVSKQTTEAIGKRTAFTQTQAQNEAVSRQVRDMVHR